MHPQSPENMQSWMPVNVIPLCVSSKNSEKSLTWCSMMTISLFPNSQHRTGRTELARWVVTPAASVPGSWQANSKSTEKKVSQWRMSIFSAELRCFEELRHVLPPSCGWSEIPLYCVLTRWIPSKITTKEAHFHEAWQVSCQFKQFHHFKPLCTWLTTSQGQVLKWKFLFCFKCSDLSWTSHMSKYFNKDMLR